jgi:hypothetical protein
MTRFRWWECALEMLYSLLFITALVGVIGILAHQNAAQAHGAAAWIMQNPETRYCCGPQDCEMLPNSQVKRVSGGYLVQVPNGELELIKDGDWRIHWSIDEHYWICRYQSGLEIGHARCFFPPTIGM